MKPKPTRLDKIVEQYKDFDGVVFLRNEGRTYLCQPWLAKATNSATVQVVRITGLIFDPEDFIVELNQSELIDAKAELSLLGIKYKVVQVVFSEDTVDKN